VAITRIIISHRRRKKVMKKILGLLSEPRRKRLASAAVGNQAEFLNALDKNA
jgi:hypothetical protein